MSYGPVRIFDGINLAVPDGNLAQKLTRALEMVRLEALRDRYPAELSGGQSSASPWRERLL